MDTGRISEGAGGSPGFESSVSDKGGIRSVLDENHIAHRGRPNHPLTGLGPRFFSSFFQRLTSVEGLPQRGPETGYWNRLAGTGSARRKRLHRAALSAP